MSAIHCSGRPSQRQWSELSTNFRILITVHRHIPTTHVVLFARSHWHASSDCAWGIGHGRVEAICAESYYAKIYCAKTWLNRRQSYLPTPTAVFTSDICLSVFQHDISKNLKTNAARITKLDTGMLHDKSWKPIILFWGHESQKHCRHESLHSCECLLLLVKSEAAEGLVTMSKRISAVSGSKVTESRATF